MPGLGLSLPVVSALALLAGTGTPVTPVFPEMEAVISPPVDYERPTYQFTKHGLAYAADPANTYFGGGIYWQSRLIHRPTAEFPYRYFSYHGWDHVPSRGGLSMYVVMADSDDPAEWEWKWYPQARDAGWLADFSNLPTGNILSAPTTFSGFETPCILKVGSTWVCYMSAKTGAIGGRGQSTIRGTSPDGLVWNWNANAVLKVPSTEVMGDGDVTYFPWGPNPFNDVINPATGQKWAYVGYSLASGTNRSLQAMWGCDEPIAGEWVFLTALNKTGGRAAPTGPVGDWSTFAFINADVQGAQVTPQGVSMLCSAATRGAGGSSTSAGAVYEIIVAHDGKTITHKPIPVLTIGGAGAIDARSVNRGEVSVVRGRLTFMYTAVDANNYGSAGIATSPWRNPLNTWAEALTPAIPAGLTTRTFNFKGASALPAGLTTITAGTTPPTPVFSAEGLSVTVDGTMATKGEYLLFDNVGFDPATAEYAEIYLEGWATTSSTAYRDFAVGFMTRKQILAAQTDGLFLTSNATNGTRLAYKFLDGGVVPANRPVYSSDYHWGTGGGTSVATTAASKKGLGLKLWPQEDLAIAMGEGRVEMEELRTSNGSYGANLPEGELMYAVVAFRGNDTAPATERIARLTVRVKDVGGGIITPPTPTSLVNATFDGVPNSTLLTAYTPETGAAPRLQPGTSQSAGGAATIVNGAVVVPGGSGSTSAAYQIPTVVPANTPVKMDMATLSKPSSSDNNQRGGPTFRASLTEATFYNGRHTQPGAGGAGQRTWDLLRFNKGTVKVVGTFPGQSPVDGTREVEFVPTDVGNTVVVEGFVDGVSIGTVTDSDADRITADGCVGFRISYSNASSTETTGLHVRSLSARSRA